MLENAVSCLMFATGDAEGAEGVVSLLSKQGFGVTRAAESRECLDLLGEHRWHFLVVDASDAPDSLGVLSQARETRPDVPAIVLVRRGDVEMAVRAMKVGAVDCIETPTQAACLLAAIARFNGPSAGKPEQLWVRLTRVEQTVVWHVVNGCTNRQIADVLCRSPRTIEVHRRHIMKKLEADNLIELVKRAMKAGMLTERPNEVAEFGT